jgi:hypothetical protein
VSKNFFLAWKQQKFREIEQSHFIPGRKMESSELGLKPSSTTSLLCGLGQVT